MALRLHLELDALQDQGIVLAKIERSVSRPIVLEELGHGEEESKKVLEDLLSSSAPPRGVLTDADLDEVTAALLRLLPFPEACQRREGDEARPEREDQWQGDCKRAEGRQTENTHAADKVRRHSASIAEETEEESKRIEQDGKSLAIPWTCPLLREILVDLNISGTFPFLLTRITAQSFSSLLSAVRFLQSAAAELYGVSIRLRRISMSGQEHGEALSAVLTSFLRREPLTAPSFPALPACHSLPLSFSCPSNHVPRKPLELLDLRFSTISTHGFVAILSALHQQWREYRDDNERRLSGEETEEFEEPRALQGMRKGPTLCWVEAAMNFLHVQEVLEFCSRTGLSYCLGGNGSDDQQQVKGEKRVTGGALEFRANTEAYGTPLLKCSLKTCANRCRRESKGAGKLGSVLSRRENRRGTAPRREDRHERLLVHLPQLGDQLSTKETAATNTTPISPPPSEAEREERDVVSASACFLSSIKQVKGELVDFLALSEEEILLFVRPFVILTKTERGRQESREAKEEAEVPEERQVLCVTVGGKEKGRTTLEIYRLVNYLRRIKKQEDGMKRRVELYAEGELARLSSGSLDLRHGASGFWLQRILVQREAEGPSPFLHLLSHSLTLRGPINKDYLFLPPLFGDPAHFRLLYQPADYYDGLRPAQDLVRVTKESRKGILTHRQRALVFGQFLVRAFNLTSKGQNEGRAMNCLLDVAGGSGDLSVYLSLFFGIQCVIVDPRLILWSDREETMWIAHCSIESQLHTITNRLLGATASRVIPKRPVQVRCYLNEELMQDQTFLALAAASSALVGLHTDQATDFIFKLGRLLNKRIAVVPCCVYPNLFPLRRTVDGALVLHYSQLCNYLKGEFGPLEEEDLPLCGARGKVFYSALT